MHAPLFFEETDTPMLGNPRGLPWFILCISSTFLCNRSSRSSFLTAPFLQNVGHPACGPVVSETRRLNLGRNKEVRKMPGGQAPPKRFPPRGLSVNPG